MDLGGPGSSAMVFIKSGCKTKRFMDTMVHLIGLVMMGELQTLWNALLDEDVFRQLHFETLDGSFFVDGEKTKVTDEGLMVYSASGSMVDEFDRVEMLFDN